MRGFLVILDFSTELNQKVGILNLKFPEILFCPLTPAFGLLFTPFLMHNNFSRSFLIKHFFKSFFITWGKIFSRFFQDKSYHSFGFVRGMKAASFKYETSDFLIML
jgi:hypothetical protein